MKPEPVEIAASDGHKTHAVLQFPPGDGPFPGIVVIHGGMGGQTSETVMEFATDERHPPRRLLREGYAILTSDYRHPSLGHIEVDDTIAAYDVLRAHPKVDPERVGLCGTSHGGVCATFAGMRIRPRCIVAEEASTDFAFRYRQLNEYIRANPDQLEGFLQLDKDLWDEVANRLGGTPDEVPEAYEKASGHSQAWKIESPILIISGDGEYLPHCLTMAAALLRANKPCEFAMYENAPHAFWWWGFDIPAFAPANERILAFLRRHLKPESRLATRGA